MNPQNRPNGGATLGYQAQLWRMADALRGSMDAAEYNHVVLGLIFLKCISDAVEQHRARLEAERTEGAAPEDPDEYRAANVFWVPPEARGERLREAISGKLGVPDRRQCRLRLYSASHRPPGADWAHRRPGAQRADGH